MPHHRQKLHDGRTERVADSEQNQWVDYPCGDNPVAKAYLQTMKDLLTQMERMSSTQQFADSLAEPLTWPNKDEPPAMEQSTAGEHFM